MNKFVRYVLLILLVFSSCAHSKDGANDEFEFAEDVLLHVVLHEIGHGLIREFDIPVLGNEETMAEAFATHYLTQYLPDRALDVLTARTTSLVLEAGEIPRDMWTTHGEHNNDARRAYQIAALAVAADPEKYSALGKRLGMTESDLKEAQDYGSEIHRSWRRVLRPLSMPIGMKSNEARVRVDSDDNLVTQFNKGPLLDDIRDVLTSFDWHSQITVYFIQGDGGASWSRSKRTISVYSQYIQRFLEQARELP